MLRTAGERASLATKPELVVDERTALPHSPTTGISVPPSLLIFAGKELPIISAIVNKERNLPFATALLSSFICGSSLSSSTVKRDILSPGCTNSRFELCYARLQVVPLAAAMDGECVRWLDDFGEDGVGGF
ncbi:hypothetical protein TIFTF001_012033 [Ficus carica]|uniref:Uncharacterized protein n=1 Tax=Ficus carica TaxID=3494 RepID=A0AA88D1B6_FICCA|nr:hypothetical protein TIFTF001_012033 [Ficus carica]